jgi:hypothetical protein
MTTAAATASIRPLPGLSVRTAARPVDVACWGLFALAAVLFVLDATVTMEVLARQPLAVERNPVARWALDLHPVAPYVLKGAIVAELWIVVALVRGLGETWAAFVVSALMGAVGVYGIGTALVALAG